MTPHRREASRPDCRTDDLLDTPSTGIPQGGQSSSFSGALSSRLLHPPEGPTTSLGARVIVVERPGFGLSDFQRGCKLLDWPEDVIAFADAMGIEDAKVSLSAARHVADTIPDCHATFLPGKGHWLYLEHWEELLRSLLS